MGLIMTKKKEKREKIEPFEKKGNGKGFVLCVR